MTVHSSHADADYVSWLHNHFATPNNHNPSTSRQLLVEQMYNKPFLWIVKGDDNRAIDGRYLRTDYTHLTGLAVDHDEPCNFLEMVVALAQRIDYDTSFSETYGVAEWVIEMLRNAQLWGYTNERYSGDEMTHEVVDEILDEIVNRTYLPNGQGGFFPLRNPPADQTTVELWYQKAAYLNEHENLW